MTQNTPSRLHGCGIAAVRLPLHTASDANRRPIDEERLEKSDLRLPGPAHSEARPVILRHGLCQARAETPQGRPDAGTLKMARPQQGLRLGPGTLEGRALVGRQGRISEGLTAEASPNSSGRLVPDFVNLRNRRLMSLRAAGRRRLRSRRHARTAREREFPSAPGMPEQPRKRGDASGS